MADYNEIDILIAEDDPTDAESMILAFKKINLAEKVHWVKDGEETLDFLYCRKEYATRDPSLRPKLMLLDLRMPKVDGFEVLRTLKADESMRSIPIVVMTVSNQERDVIECYRLGMNSFVIKPADFAFFTETIMKLSSYWLSVNRTPQL